MERMRAYCCDLSALDRGQRERRAELAGRLPDDIRQVADLPGGYAVHLEPGSSSARHAAELMALERLCCPFLDFTLREGAGGVVIVEITGGPDARAFIAAEFGLRGPR